MSPGTAPSDSRHQLPREFGQVIRLMKAAGYSRPEMGAMEVWEIASALGVGEPEPPPPDGVDDQVVARLQGPVPAMMNASGQTLASVPVAPVPQRRSAPTVAERMRAAGYTPESAPMPPVIGPVG